MQNRASRGMPVRIYYIIPFSGGLLVGILSWAGIRNWRWLMGILSAPAALLSLLYFIIPESPRWLLAKGNKYKCKIYNIHVIITL